METTGSLFYLTTIGCHTCSANIRPRETSGGVWPGKNKQYFPDEIRARVQVTKFYYIIQELREKHMQVGNVTLDFYFTKIKNLRRNLYVS
jgi:hypothetical protein